MMYDLSDGKVDNLHKIVALVKSECKITFSQLINYFLEMNYFKYRLN